MDRSNAQTTRVLTNSWYLVPYHNCCACCRNWDEEGEHSGGEPGHNCITEMVEEDKGDN